MNIYTSIPIESNHTTHNDTHEYRDFHDVNIMNYDGDAISSSIRNCLMTRKGSLPGKPDFGSELYRIPFSLLDYVTEDLFRTTIKAAINNWDSRVLISEVNFKNIEERNQMIANILYEYNFNNINVNGNLSIPLRGL